MASRRSQFPQVVIGRDSDSEESLSDEEEEFVEEEDDEEVEEVEEEEEDEEVETKDEEKTQEGLSEDNKGKAPITISLKKVCKVRIFLSHFIIFVF